MARSKLAYPPALQNRGSQHHTPASYGFDLHYAQLGVIARWDWQRYARLASFLNLTAHELASLICLPHSSVSRAERNNRFSGPACLILTMLEAQVTKDFGGDIIENPIPPIK